jgi:hypothetical protein
MPNRSSSTLRAGLAPAVLAATTFAAALISALPPAARAASPGSVTLRYAM